MYIDSHEVVVKDPEREKQTLYTMPNTVQDPLQNVKHLQLDDLNENGGLTMEQEQSADELIADIQRSVDEMLMGFQNSPLVSPEPPSPANVTVSLTYTLRDG